MDKLTEIENRYRDANEPKSVNTVRMADRIFVLEKQVEGFWEHLENNFEIDSREELESKCKHWNPKNPLVVALHYIWKRDPKVKALEKKVEGLREYTVHLNTCAIHRGLITCTCGLDELLKQSKEV